MIESHLVVLSRISLEDELAAAGFTRRRADHQFTRKGIAFHIEEDWPVLRSGPCPESTDPLLDMMGKCGLWKCVTDRGDIRRSFDLPPSVISSPENPLCRTSNSGKSPLVEMLDWASETIEGRAPEGWSRPRQEEIYSMIPREGLTIQTGSLVRQAELVLGDGKLALRFRIIHALPEDLAECRQRWLRRLLIDAQNRWRLVRVGFMEDQTGRGVQAEIDLTGAPHSLLGELVGVALSALRIVVGWISASALFLIDGPERCPALEMEVIEDPCGKSRESPKRRKKATTKGGERRGRNKGDGGFLPIGSDVGHRRV